MLALFDDRFNAAQNSIIMASINPSVSQYILHKSKNPLFSLNRGFLRRIAVWNKLKCANVLADMVCNQCRNASEILSPKTNFVHRLQLTGKADRMDSEFLLKRMLYLIMNTAVPSEHLCSHAVCALCSILQASSAPREHWSICSCWHTMLAVHCLLSFLVMLFFPLYSWPQSQTSLVDAFFFSFFIYLSCESWCVFTGKTTEAANGRSFFFFSLPVSKGHLLSQENTLFFSG